MSAPASEEITQSTTAPEPPDAWDNAALWLAKHGALPAVCALPAAPAPCFSLDPPQLQIKAGASSSSAAARLPRR